MIEIKLFLNGYDGMSSWLLVLCVVAMVFAFCLVMSSSIFNDFTSTKKNIRVIDNSVAGSKFLMKIEALIIQSSLI